MLDVQNASRPSPYSRTCGAASARAFGAVLPRASNLGSQNTYAKLSSVRTTDGSSRTSGQHKPTTSRPRSATVSTMTSINSNSPYGPFTLDNPLQKMNRGPIGMRPAHLPPQSPTGRRRRNSIASCDSELSNSSNDASSSSKSNNSSSIAPNSSDTTPVAWKNWWCNSCKRPREECECLCVIS